MSRFDPADVVDILFGVAIAALGLAGLILVAFGAAAWLGWSA